MIQSNTIPDIFDKNRLKKKKKHKIDYYVHVESRNRSFTKMWALLKMLGIKNNTFFLALYDTELIDVDPYDLNLSPEMKARVLAECMRNFWYFIREVVRIPVAGSDIGGGKKYELHRGNLAINYCVINNINCYAELPRQVGKSIAIDVILLWLYNFGTSNSQMLVMNKEHDDAKDNLGRVLNIRDTLPEYLQFKYRYNEEGKKLKPQENKESVMNQKTRNQLITKSSAKSKEEADKKGRGMTMPFQWFDEFAFLKFNGIIYKSASPAASQASREAASNGKPYAKVITSTPGDMKTEHGDYAYKFIHRSAAFLENFYDWKINDVREYIERNSVNGFTYIKFSYRQLGRSQRYFDEQVQALDGDMAAVRREVLLQWNNMATDSPFDEDDIKELETSAREPIKTLRINKFYMLNLYEEIDFEYPTIVSVDVASGHRKDSSAISLISTRTKRLVGELVNNKIDTTNLSSVIYTIAKSVVPNCLIIIERNGIGEGVVSNLTHTDIKNKLFYEYSSSDIKEKIKSGFIHHSDDSVRTYGLWNDDKKRDLMFEKLMLFVTKFKNRINIKPFVEQMKILQYNKAGRIDHVPGQHDDLVMSYLLGIYVYYHEDLAQYGIIRFPDYEDIDDEEEELEKYEQKQANVQQLNAKLYRTLVDDDDSEQEENAYSELMQFDDIKTIGDYYKNIEDEIYHAERGKNRNTAAAPMPNAVNAGFFKSLYNNSYESGVEDMFKNM